MYTVSNGVKHLVTQCLSCGKKLSNITKATHPREMAIAAQNPPFDLDLRRRYWEERRSSRREHYVLSQEERQRNYDTYMASPAWWAKRQARMAMDRRRCQAALDGCAIHASDVHHLTYAHFGNEPLFDLVSVCRSCHIQITAMDHGES